MKKVQLVESLKGVLITEDIKRVFVNTGLVIASSILAMLINLVTEQIKGLELGSFQYMVQIVLFTVLKTVEKALGSSIYKK